MPQLIFCIFKDLVSLKEKCVQLTNAYKDLYHFGIDSLKIKIPLSGHFLFPFPDITFFYFIDLTSLGSILKMAKNETNSTWLDPSFSLCPYVPLDLQTHTNALLISLFCLSCLSSVLPLYLFSLILSHLVSYCIPSSPHCPPSILPSYCSATCMLHTLPFLLPPPFFFAPSHSLLES